MTHFNKSPSYGLSAEVMNKIASKYDHQAEEDLRNWIEKVTGMSVGPNFQQGLKDIIILCKLINKLQPGSVKKVSESSLNRPQLGNIGNFIKAIQAYVASQKGMSVYGLGQQVYDPKYCAAPRELVIHDGSQGTGTNGSEISDSDYQAECPDEYHSKYPDYYPKDYQYGDQGIDD
ncbi:Calponin-3 [Heterocephalus glaber]|uniref:Calponin-3 n=1 Tax=Heterocephalus glaber TaxID=10181 RepID=G5B7X1_HETGA|nr:Calponin-3 [Heterocephalus glaber]